MGSLYTARRTYRVGQVSGGCAGAVFGRMTPVRSDANNNELFEWSSLHDLRESKTTSSLLFTKSSADLRDNALIANTCEPKPKGTFARFVRLFHSEVNVRQVDPPIGTYRRLQAKVFSVSVSIAGRQESVKQVCKTFRMYFCTVL